MSLMTKPVSGRSGDYKPAPAGTHIAILIGIYDLGHHQESWDGVTSWKPKVLLTWELSEELMDDGRPFTISRTFNLSLHENAAFRKFLEPWRGKFTDQETAGWDVREMLGKPCMLTVAHNQDKADPQKTWANVMAATPLSKRDAARPPKPVNDLTVYAVEDGEPPASFPAFIRSRILASREFDGKGGKAIEAKSEFKPPQIEGPDCPF